LSQGDPGRKEMPMGNFVMEDNSEVPLHVVLSLPIWQANSHSLRLSSMTLDVRKHSFMPNLEQIDPEHSPLWQT
jgi:hypothetical protein